MGRPIQNDVFGDTVAPGLQFAITAKLPGVSVGEGFIVEQTGTSKYKVNISGNIGDVFLVNTVTPANLNDGEAFIAVNIFGGSTVAAYKIMQRRVNVWLTPDSALSAYRSYTWSENAADAVGEADVGVSTAVVASNALSSTNFIYEQTPSGDIQPFITTFRALGWSSQDMPGNGQHQSFATSDNKVVLFYESNPANGIVDGGAVVVLDGTTATVPTVIGGGEITSTWETMGAIDEAQTRTIQLTDTRYARLTSFDTATVTYKDRIEIVDVNLSTGAASIDITHDLEQYYDALSLNSGNQHKVLVKISSTRFAVLFPNAGISTPTTASGAAYCMVFDDAGTSIDLQMSKTSIIDITDPTYNEGDTASTVTRINGVYLGGVDRIIMMSFESNRNGIRDAHLMSFALNGTFDGITTIGAPHTFIDNEGSTATYIARIDDTHALVSDEDRQVGLRSPLYVAIAEVNTSTLVTTTGAKIYAGPQVAQTNVGVYADYEWLIDGTKAYLVCGYENRDNEQIAGTVSINQSAFDGTADIDRGDRLVDTAANLTTAWPGVFSSTTVLAVDTGLVHNYNGATWEVPTTNISRWDYNGLAFIEVDLDVGTNTVTHSKFDLVLNNQNERFESDGAGGVRYTYAHCGFESGGNNLVKLPNGNYVATIGESYQKILEDAPFNTKAESDGAGTLLRGGDFVGMYFYPAAMP